MTRKMNVCRVFAPACFMMMAAVLHGQTQPNTLKGNYILAEEGVGGTGPVALLANLVFAEDGTVSGKQVLRNNTGMRSADLRGFYAFDAASTGTLTLDQTVDDAEGNIQTVSTSYRFASMPTGIEAIRTNSELLSVARLLPARDNLSGTLVFSEVRREASVSRVVSITIDEPGNVTGTSITRRMGAVTVANIGGSYVKNSDGFGRLTLLFESKDEEENTVSVSETYTVASANGAAVILRADESIRLTFASATLPTAAGPRR